MALGFDLLLSSRTGMPIVEATRAVGTALRRCGFDTRIVKDRIPAHEDDRAIVVVGPHDVYPHLNEAYSAEVNASLARTILLCCERPHSSAWENTVGLAEHAGALLHASDLGVAAFGQHRLPARRFRWGYDPSLDGWHGAQARRPIDVLFMGAWTARREQTLAQAAEVLAGYDVDIRLTSGVSTGSREVANFISDAPKRELLAASKIVLNIHPGDDLAFEWNRTIDAISNGCVLVTEASLGLDPLRPGEHLVSGSIASLPLLLDALLRDPERLDAIRCHAYEFVRQELSLVGEVRILAELAAGLPPRPPVARNFMRQEEHEPPPPAGADPPEPATHPPDETSLLLAKQNAVMKKLFFDLRLLRRQVARLSHSVENPSAPLTELTATPGDGTLEPQVTVVVTVHNYARFIEEALLSVLGSQGVALETIVVDDASIDGSAEIVHSVMERYPAAAIRLIEQRVNTGVQRARNLAFEHARAPYAFVLDADNAVYPRGIAHLLTALARDPKAGFSYGLIERFGSHGPTGLMGWEPWDPVLLSQRNYIDAMALIRVDAWRQVGGYVTDPTMELGWEDYDLWLSFAVAGLHGAHTREIVGRYRVHGVSSLTMTTLDTDDLMAKLRDRHASFFAAVGGGG